MRFVPAQVKVMQLSCALSGLMNELFKLEQKVYEQQKWQQLQDEVVGGLDRDPKALCWIQERLRCSEIEISLLKDGLRILGETEENIIAAVGRGMDKSSTEMPCSLIIT